MTGVKVIEREVIRPTYQRKVVDTMTDAEIKNKLCRDAGCEGCEVFDSCRYGREAKKRGLLK